MADTKVGPEIYGKRVLKNDTDDSHIKLSDAIDLSKWRKMTRENWSNRSSDSDADAESSIQ